MNEREQFSGPSGRVDAGAHAAQIDVAAEDEWVYCEVVMGVLQIWSGRACHNCKLTQGGLTRCELHRGVKMIAMQLRLK
jgi:hypothetical protein